MSARKHGAHRVIIASVSVSTTSVASARVSHWGSGHRTGVLGRSPPARIRKHTPINRETHDCVRSGDGACARGCLHCPNWPDQRDSAQRHPSLIRQAPASSPGLFQVQPSVRRSSSGHIDKARSAPAAICGRLEGLRLPGLLLRVAPCLVPLVRSSP